AVLRTSSKARPSTARRPAASSRSVPPGRSSSSQLGSRKAVTRCDLCGAHTARIRHVTRSFGRGERLVVIENIPYVLCSRCGERGAHRTGLSSLRAASREKRPGAAGAGDVLAWPVGQAGGLLAYGMLLDTMGRQEEAAVRFFSRPLDIGPSSRDESQLAVRPA